MIQAGVQAEIIGGVLEPSPNLGKRVTVLQLRGEHSQHGRIWRVRGENLVTEYGAVGDEIDCAQQWLRRIDDDEPVFSRDVDELLIAGMCR